MSITLAAHRACIYDLLIATYDEPRNEPDYDLVGGLIGTMLSEHGDTRPLLHALDELRQMQPEEAWRSLRTLPGVGLKTATIE